MKQFERALDFIKTHENNAEVLALFLEQLLVEATEEMTQTALDNTEDFLYNALTILSLPKYPTKTEGEKPISIVCFSLANWKKVSCKFDP